MKTVKLHGKQKFIPIKPAPAKNLTLDDCYRIAVESLRGRGIELNKVYKLGDAYVFDNFKETWEGILPIVVEATSGDVSGLWQYLGDHDLTMDDMEEIVEK